jgi:hypothetical protein
MASLADAIDAFQALVRPGEALRGELWQVLPTQLMSFKRQ